MSPSVSSSSITNTRFGTFNFYYCGILPLLSSILALLKCHVSQMIASESVILSQLYKFMFGVVLSGVY